LPLTLKDSINNYD